MSKKSKLTDLLPAISLAELRPQLRQAGIDLLSRREHTRFQRGQGPLRIQQELRQRRVADVIVRTAFEGCELDWFELARAGAAKKLGVSGELARVRLADQKEKARVYRFLSYRGFNTDQIQYALDACCEDSEDQGE